MTAPFYRHLTSTRRRSPATGPFSLGGTLAGITLGGWLVGADRGGARAAVDRMGADGGDGDVCGAVADRRGSSRAVCDRDVRGVRAGLADAAFLTFLSALCAREFAATQYALLSSVPQLAIHTIGGVSGVMAASLGWTLFYAVCMAGALPGMGLMVSCCAEAPARGRARPAPSQLVSAIPPP